MGQGGGHGGGGGGGGGGGAQHDGVQAGAHVAGHPGTHGIALRFSTFSVSSSTSFVILTIFPWCRYASVTFLASNEAINRKATARVNRNMTRISYSNFLAWLDDVERSRIIVTSIGTHKENLCFDISIRVL